MKNISQCFYSRACFYSVKTYIINQIIQPGQVAWLIWDHRVDNSIDKRKPVDFLSTGGSEIREEKLSSLCKSYRGIIFVWPETYQWRWMAHTKWTILYHQIMSIKLHFMLPNYCIKEVCYNSNNTLKLAIIPAPTPILLEL
jgi:hypothetical protein